VTDASGGPSERAGGAPRLGFNGFGRLRRLVKVG